MCLLFVYVNPDPKEGEYKVVIVNNRDEFYTRPTKPAHIWDSGIIAGKDMELGREGGTWLGINECGKIGCLLNVLQPKNEFSKEGAPRGHLVTNYLAGNNTGLEYMEKIINSGLKYNPFNLVILEPKEKCYELFYLNSSIMTAEVLEQKVYGFGNTYLRTPFKKIQKGQMKLEEIVKSLGRKSSEQKLIEELFLMMNDREMNLPDDQLTQQGCQHPEIFLQELSKIFVCSPIAKYGSRTTTVILIDHNDNVIYKEKTMEEPINLDDVKWIENEYPLKIQK